VCAGRWEQIGYNFSVDGTQVYTNLRAYWEFDFYRRLRATPLPDREHPVCRASLAADETRSEPAQARTAVEMHPRMAANGGEAVILLRDPECRKRVRFDPFTKPSANGRYLRIPLKNS
jgi:hypothetical protein